MIYCRHCGQHVWKAGSHAANDNEQLAPDIYVASDWELRRAAHYCRMAIVLGELKKSLGLPRRQIADWLSDTIYSYPGRILLPDGRPYSLPEIDDAFNNDGSFRWLSDFLRATTEPPRQQPQRRILARLRLIDLALRIDKHRRDQCSQ